MDYKVFIGIDISKLTIDAAVKYQDRVHSEQFSNDRQGHLNMISWAKKKAASKTNEWILCLEHTGIYSLELSAFLSQEGYAYCLENPYHLKHSMGLQRAKTDKVDAEKIADYISRNYDRVKLHTFPGHTLVQLQNLLAHRARLVKAKVAITVPAAELKRKSSVENKLIMKSSQRMADVYDAEIKAAEKEMKSLIDQDPELKKNFDLATSVIGVGLIITATMLVHTNNFRSITESRKFSAYSGVAPFPYSSGTSIQRKDRVSHLANKNIKTLLTQGAISAIKFDPQIQAYYNRKIEEGKNRFSVQNAVKNKLVGTIFSVVKRGTPFVKLGNYNNPKKVVNPLG